LEKRNNASNALAKALLAAPLKSLATELESAGSHLESWLASLEDELLKIDSHWPEHDPQAMNLLADSFSYAGRWQTQLGERKLALDYP
jgi:hypothetical protein